MNKTKWTLEKLEEEALKYKTKSEFQKGSKSAYNTAHKNGLIDKVTSHMPGYKDLSGDNNPNFKWTHEMLLEEALKYKTRTEFKNHNPKAYGAAWRSKKLDTYCSHMGERKNEKWTEEDLRAEALKYKTKSEFSLKNNGAYQIACKKNINKIAPHLNIKNDLNSQNNSNFKWSEEDIFLEAKKYSTKNEFNKKNNKMYHAAQKRGLLDKACSHMPNRVILDGEKSPVYKWTDEMLKKEALKYNNRIDFVKKNNSAYQIATERGLLDKICSHMEYLCYPWSDEELAEEAKKYRSRTEFEQNEGGAYRACLKRNLLKDLVPKLSGTSIAQKDIFNFINNYYSDAIEDTKNIISPKELDIFIPMLNIAVEYCGLRWHNENSPEPRNRAYHYSKMKKCQEKEIRLITIFEDEWLERQEQVKNFLLSAINKNSIKLYARKTDLKKVEKEETILFLDQNHIQGSPLFEVAFGLYSNNELVAIITGNKHHRQGHDNIFVLNRLAFKHDVSIAGGSSKLLKALITYAKENNYSKIISWSDNRWSEGNVYKQLGFELTDELGPDYSYVKGQKRISKQSCKKENLAKKGAVGKTEKEMALSLGYYRIWDCGKKRWEIKL